MIPDDKLVSVIMGTYNGEKMIGKAIESILNQTYKRIELIICDDCSTDQTIEVIKRYREKDNRIVLLRNKKNVGLAETLNTCIKEAKGDYIARMDDDDISHLGRIEKQVDFLERHSEYALVGTARNNYDENGIWAKVIMKKEPTVEDIYRGNSFVHPTVIMRKDILNKVGNYTVPAPNKRAEDYDLWCKFYAHGYLGANLEEVLLDYCESKDSVKRRKFKYRWLFYKQMLYWRKKFSLPSYYRIYAYKRLMVGLIPKTWLMNYKKFSFRMAKSVE